MLNPYHILCFKESETFLQLTFKGYEPLLLAIRNKENKNYKIAQLLLDNNIIQVQGII